MVCFKFQNTFVSLLFELVNSSFRKVLFSNLICKWIKVIDSISLILQYQLIARKKSFIFYSLVTFCANVEIFATNEQDCFWERKSMSSSKNFKILKLSAWNPLYVENRWICSYCFEISRFSSKRQENHSRNRLPCICLCNSCIPVDLFLLHSVARRFPQAFALFTV